MTSVYDLLRDACGISQAEAAEHVHETRLDTVKTWSSNRRPAPSWAINQLQSLLRRIGRAGEDYAALVKQTAEGNVFLIGLAHDDRDARACGFPSIAAQMQASAIAISLLPDDAEIRLIPRIRGSIPAPMLQEDKVIPTASDRQVFSEMSFTDQGKFFTAGNMNRRKYERLEDIGWVKGLSVNLSDVEYHLSRAGQLELVLLKEASKMERDVPNPVGAGGQVLVNSQPRRSAGITLRVGGRHNLDRHNFTVDAIEGDVVTVRFDSGAEAILNVPPILLA